MEFINWHDVIMMAAIVWYHRPNFYILSRYLWW
jgi:hypothetical protein